MMKQIFGYLGFVCILFEMQRVSGCITQQYSSGNTMLELNCAITSFTGSGIWRLDGVDRTSCLSGGFCTTITSGSYTFTSNNSGIYLKINPYSHTEAGKLWICIHAPTSCNITVDPPSESTTSITTTQMNTTPNPLVPCGFGGCEWILPSLGLLAVIFMIFCCCCKWIRSRNNGRTPGKNGNATLSTQDTGHTENHTINYTV